nr:PQQ-binding-like beta-propeller repeat protein [Microlunatus antarcticus]
MLGTVATTVHPVLTSSGLVVRALQAPDDLVATTPKTIDAWTPAWSVHPGGTVLSLAAFGSVVLVTTSERALVAYSDAGMRLWSAALPEIGPNAPVRVSGDDAVVVDLSGRVLRFGIADGAVRWTGNVPGDVNLTPAAGSGVVVVADRRGTVTALDAASGATRWDRSFAASAVAVVGDRVLVTEDQNLDGLDPATGTTRFLTHFDGGLTALTGFAGRPVVASKEATLLLDADGRVTARLPGYLAVDPTATHLAGWTSDRLDVVGGDGRVAATWPTRSTSLVSSERPGLATPQGLYLFGYTKGWTFDSWTTGG